jgi:bifunctional non-homologous end joining protein LigD
MALDRYIKKRNFSTTPEPPGKKRITSSKKLRFVVQEHHATQLHFDFRLEMEGVLKSWAVPKGPSLDPKDKRLAMHVEDHPRAYGSFHGSIPAGNYGAGEVRIWDSGTYETVSGESPLAELRSGNLKIILQGKKLKGEFHLIQMHRDGEEKAWLLFKHKDDYAEPGWKLTRILDYGSRAERAAKTKTKKSNLAKLVQGRTKKRAASTSSTPKSTRSKTRKLNKS